MVCWYSTRSSKVSCRDSNSKTHQKRTYLRSIGCQMIPVHACATCRVHHANVSWAEEIVREADGGSVKHSWWFILRGYERLTIGASKVVVSFGVQLTAMGFYYEPLTHMVAFLFGENSFTVWKNMEECEKSIIMRCILDWNIILRCILGWSIWFLFLELILFYAKAHTKLAGRKSKTLKYFKRFPFIFTARYIVTTSFSACNSANCC